jgi:hypothetical protein
MDANAQAEPGTMPDSLELLAAAAEENPPQSADVPHAPHLDAARAPAQDLPAAKKPRRAAAQAARNVISSAALVLRGVEDIADSDSDCGPLHPSVRGGAFAPRPGTWGHAQIMASLGKAGAAYTPGSDQHVQMILQQAAQQQAQQYHQARQQQGPGQAADDEDDQQPQEGEDQQPEQPQQPWQPQELPWQLQQAAWQPQALPDGLKRKNSNMRGRAGPRPAIVDASAPAFRGGAAKRQVQPKSRFKGLAWDHRERAWRVRVSFNGKQRHIGRCGGGWAQRVGGRRLLLAVYQPAFACAHCMRSVLDA